eukprot:3427831-Lingulodinium_polyedra.AAC.1
MRPQRPALRTPRRAGTAAPQAGSPPPRRRAATGGRPVRRRPSDGRGPSRAAATARTSAVRGTT